MQVTVSGKSLDVGAALKTHVEERLNKGVQKYFERAIHGDVVFSKESHLLRADIHVNEGTGNGVLISATGKSSDVYAAFDDAVDRIEKQLRRYKRKLKDHSKKKLADLDRKDLAILSGKKFVLSNDNSREEEEAEEDSPLIIAEKTTPIEELTVGEAVMRMNLANLPALMFINKAHGRLNVVYHREDGNISWVDPQQK